MDKIDLTKIAQQYRVRAQQYRNMIVDRQTKELDEFDEILGSDRVSDEWLDQAAAAADKRAEFYERLANKG